MNYRSVSIRNAAGLIFMDGFLRRGRFNEAKRRIEFAANYEVNTI